jgi:hypothetical protein
MNWIAPYAASYGGVAIADPVRAGDGILYPEAVLRADDRTRTVPLAVEQIAVVLYVRDALAAIELVGETGPADLIVWYTATTGINRKRVYQDVVWRGYPMTETLPVGEGGATPVWRLDGIIDVGDRRQEDVIGDVVA